MKHSLPVLPVALYLLTDNVGKEDALERWQKE